MSNYDLAVVGSGLAGLAAAAAASRMKQRTILLEQRGTAGGAFAFFEKDGFRFYPGPSLSYEFERGGLFQSLAENLGMSQNASLRSPCYQVALPDRRITVFAEHSETLDELRREFGPEIDRISRFYRELRKHAERNSRNRVSSFISRQRSAVSFIRDYRFSPEFTLFLDVQSRYFFRRTLETLPLSSLIRLIDSAPLTVSGGFKRLVDHLVATIVRNKGEIRYNVPFSDLKIRRQGIDLSSGPIEAKAVLLNVRARQRLSLCMGVQEQVVPVSMLPDVLCVPSYSKPECFFALCLSDKDDESTAPRGKRSLIASFSSPCEDQSQENCMSSIAAIIPFINEFSVLFGNCSPPIEPLRIPPEIDFKPVLSSGRGPLLMRSSRYGLFAVPDENDSPADPLIAALRFVEFIR